MGANFGIKYVRLENVGFYFLVLILLEITTSALFTYNGQVLNMVLKLIDWLIGQWLSVICLFHEHPSRLESLWVTTFALCRMLYIELHLLVPFQHPQRWIPKDQGMQWHWILWNRQQLCRQSGLNHCTVPVCKAEEKKDWRIGHKWQ